MSKSNLIRWGGLAAMLGGVLFIAKMLYDANDAPPWPTDITDTLIFTVPLLWLVGVAGLYARCRESLGRLGKAGFIVPFIGAAASVVGAIGVFVIGVDSLWDVFAYGLLALLAGLMLVGIATIRADALRQSSALPILIGVLGLLMFFSNPDGPGVSRNVMDLLRLTRLVSMVLYGAGWVLLGYALWLGKGETAKQPEPAT